MRRPVSPGVHIHPVTGVPMAYGSGVGRRAGCHGLRERRANRGSVGEPRGANDLMGEIFRNVNEYLREAVNPPEDARLGQKLGPVAVRLHPRLARQ